MRTHRLCLRCLTPVKRETKVKGYPFYCPCCNESNYRFETVNVKKRSLAHRPLTDIRDNEVDRELGIENEKDY